MRTRLLTGLLLMIAVATPALARGTCAPRDVVLERLSAKFGETRQSIGLGPNNQMVEVFASRDTGTWTITVTRPSGLTCLVASGQAFETLAEALPKPEKDA
ncbi:hypothetical protein GCM10011360_29970 [Primorskyibacter flagellatus]|uniref:Uncharacterized protein n=1 Tax=Primorskyibacter flagellatus TaxID=1387277 RepID=A0A917ABR7_9RHOB|nr:hypothetical protein [Primorskyibacter flagellatus]GGE40336.1 hypothetical protein GCM10011360_29970 [Primorskyibacter flagellatus]